MNTASTSTTQTLSRSRTARAKEKALAGIRRAEQRRGGLEALCLLSAGVGIPPFALIAVLLGATRPNVWRFTALGLVGRAARFLVVVGVAVAAT